MTSSALKGTFIIVPEVILSMMVLIDGKQHASMNFPAASILLISLSVNRFLFSRTVLMRTREEGTSGDEELSVEEISETIGEEGTSDDEGLIFKEISEVICEEGTSDNEGLEVLDDTGSRVNAKKPFFL
jgi:hypothetical protein